MVERASQDNIGFSNLWRGALDIKCARVVDLGYVHENRVTRATNLSRNNPSVVDWCREVRYIFRNMFEIFFSQNNVLLIYPFREKTQFFGYDGTTHTLTINEDYRESHSASYVNAARIATYLRPAVEQFHGAVFGTYKVIKIYLKIT